MVLSQDAREAVERVAVGRRNRAARNKSTNKVQRAFFFDPGNSLSKVGLAG